MDRIAAMSAFVRVVETGNFSKAAETLDLPNATVTRLIQALERELRVRLLHRTTRSVTVTPEGAIYYERVVRLLADLGDIESSVKLSQGKPSGKVRVEAAAAIATTVLLPALNEFCAEYPDIEIELGSGNQRADLVAEGIDCAIRAGEISEQMMVARQIGEFRFTTCGTPQLIGAIGAPKSLDDLLRLPTIGMVSARTGRVLPYRFVHQGESKDMALRHKLVVNDTNACLAAGLAGLGIVQVPNYAAHAALQTGRLVPVLEAWSTPTVPIHVLYAPNRYLSAKVRVFIDWTVALFERHACLRRA